MPESGLRPIGVKNVEDDQAMLIRQRDGVANCRREAAALIVALAVE